MSVSLVAFLYDSVCIARIRVARYSFTRATVALSFLSRWSSLSISISISSGYTSLRSALRPTATVVNGFRPFTLTLSVELDPYVSNRPKVMMVLRWLYSPFVAPLAYARALSVSYYPPRPSGELNRLIPYRSLAQILLFL